MLKSFAEGTVFGERFGDGPVQVLALHGWGRDRRDFDEVLRGLDAVAVDLPGFGASPAPGEAIGTAGYARLIAPVLDDARRAGHPGRPFIRRSSSRPFGRAHTRQGPSVGSGWCAVAPTGRRREEQPASSVSGGSGLATDRVGW